MKNIVLKQEGTKRTRYFSGPDDVMAFSDTQLEEMAEEFPYRWLVQEYVPALSILGEWRVVIVGGRIVYVVNTTFDEGQLFCVLRMAGYTLHEMRYAGCFL